MGERIKPAKKKKDFLLFLIPFSPPSAHIMLLLSFYYAIIWLLCTDDKSLYPYCISSHSAFILFSATNSAFFLYQIQVWMCRNNYKKTTGVIKHRRRYLLTWVFWNSFSDVNGICFNNLEMPNNILMLSKDITFSSLTLMQYGN